MTLYINFRLLSVCNYQNRSDLMKLIISSLDFAHDVQCQVILSKILTSSDKDMRLYATKHLRVLLRAKMPFFNSWGLELLIPQVSLVLLSCPLFSTFSKPMVISA